MLITNSAHEIADLVKAWPGSIFAYPTETVYGLGCPVADTEAVSRIIKAKGRDAAKGMIVLVSNIQQAKILADINPKAESLLSNFWPGALSAVLRKKRPPDEPADFLKGETIAMRVSPAIPAMELASLLGPLISTSANPSGMKPAVTAEDVISYGLAIDAVLDGGPAPGGLPSTLVDLTGTDPVCLRQGPVSFEEITRYWSSLY